MFDRHVIDILQEELDNIGWKYKDNGRELILLCPYCLNEGKEKLKLYISKEQGLYHCFRCNNSGHLYNLKLLYDLGLYSTIHYINTEITLDKLSRQIVYSTDIREELEYYKLNKDKILKNILQITKSNIEKFNSCNIKTTKLNSLALGYLQNRNIEPYRLNMLNIKYYICNNINSRLFGRILFPSYLHTTYEARAFNNSSNIRYLRTRTNIPDFVFFNIYKDKHVSFTTILKENLKIEHKNIVITEGLFDSLRLAQYNLPSISMGGKSNTVRALKFLYILQEYFGFTFDIVSFVFDNDVSKEEVENFHNYYIFDLKDIFKFEIRTFRMTEYKDINEIPESKIHDYIKLLTYP